MAANSPGNSRGGRSMNCEVCGNSCRVEPVNTGRIGWDFTTDGGGTWRAVEWACQSCLLEMIERVAVRQGTAVADEWFQALTENKSTTKIPALRLE